VSAPPRRLYGAVDREVSPRVNSLVRTDQFAQLTACAFKALARSSRQAPGAGSA
jgi:hypothetical protein